MKTTTLFTLGLIALLLSSTGCTPTQLEAQEPPPTGPATYDFPIQVISHTDTDPIPGTIVKIDGRVAGKTGNSGIFEILFKEQRKVEIEIEVEPPDGYRLRSGQSSSRTEELVVTKEGDQLKVRRIKFDVVMESMKKDNLIWVRLNCDERTTCSNIPIKLDNEVLGVTNDFGVAHFVGSSVPDRQVELVIDTPDDTSKVKYRPKDPKFAFKASLTPTVYFVEEDFENIVPPPVYQPAFTGKRSGKKGKRSKKKSSKKKKKTTSKKKKTKVPVLGSDSGSKKKKKKKEKKSDSKVIDLF